MHSLSLTFLLITLGIFAIRVLGGGEDWYDVWNEGEPYGWLNDIKEFGSCVCFALVVLLGLGFFCVVSLLMNNSYRSPSYEESTPIKVVSSPANLHKKQAHKNKVAVKRHLARQKPVSQ